MFALRFEGTQGLVPKVSTLLFSSQDICHEVRELEQVKCGINIVYKQILIRGIQRWYVKANNL